MLRKAFSCVIVGVVTTGVYYVCIVCIFIYSIIVVHAIIFITFFIAEVVGEWRGLGVAVAGGVGGVLDAAELDF